jgi:Cu+-exporting ATPase
MKSIKFILAAMSVMVMTFSCKNETQPEVKTVEVEAKTEQKAALDPNATYAKAEFGIEGMTCAMGCAKTIEKNISKMEGVKSATVDFDKQLAMVEYDVAKVTPTSLEEAVKKTGETYKVVNMNTTSTAKDHKACAADCKMACCADKKADANKTMACAKDCKMECCAKKEKV